MKALVLLVAFASPAFGQSRFEVSAGATWTGGLDAGGTDAQLSRPSAGGTPLTLFRTSSRMAAAAGFAGRATFYFTRRFGVEGAVEFSRPRLRTTISDDFENATGTEADTAVSSYGFGGSLIYRFGEGRLVPFALAGAGRLRQLDADNVNLVTAMELHVGGGVMYRLADRFSVRGDAVVSSREKSLTFDRRRSTLPVLAVSLCYRF